MHGSPSRDWLAAEFDSSAVAELLGARVAGEVATGPRITHGVNSDQRGRLPVLIELPDRRLGSMAWGIQDGYGVHTAEVTVFSGRGLLPECYRRRRCALVLTAYELDAQTCVAQTWSGPPSLFAGVFEVGRGDPRCALVVVDRRPVPMTLEEASRWMLRRENELIDVAITVAKVNEIMRWPR